MAHYYRYRRKDGSTNWGFKARDWAGTQTRKSGFRTKAEAEEGHRKWSGEQAAIRRGEIPKKRFTEMPYTKARDQYYAYGNLHGGRKGKPWAAETFRKKQERLDFWEEALGLQNLSDLVGCLPKVTEVLKTIQDNVRTGKTVSHYAEALSSFCAWLVDTELLEDNPLHKLGRIDSSPTKKHRAMTREEIQLALEVCVDWERDLLEVAICSGLRANELRSIRGCHIDPELGGLQLEEEWTKNREGGFQPLPSSVVARLLDLAAEKAPDEPLLYVPSHPAREFDKILDRAGIEKETPEGKITFHATRTAFATFIFEAGATAKEAQSLMRHSDPRLTMNVYAKTRDPRLAEVAENLGEILLRGQEGTGNGQKTGSKLVQNGQGPEKAKALTACGDKGLSASENGGGDVAGIELFSKFGRCGSEKTLSAAHAQLTGLNDCQAGMTRSLLYGHYTYSGACRLLDDLSAVCDNVVQTFERDGHGKTRKR